MSCNNHDVHNDDCVDCYKQWVRQLQEQLVQANLDIIRLERRNDSLHEDYDTMVEVISEQDAEITKLKSNQSKFSG